MELSIVTTMYRSSPYLARFYERMKKAAGQITDDYEIIFVNDGSPDDSLDMALSMREKDPRVVVVDLSRNFGHHKAIMTGLRYARGKKIFLVDCDLEEEPELLGHFNAKFMEEKDCDVVYGVQKRRKGGLFERVSGALFYKMINLLSDTGIPSNVITSRLMSRRYVKSLLMHGENELFLAGIWHITGYKQIPYEIIKHSSGATSYSLSKRVALMVNAITSFSDKPLMYIFYTGALILLLAISYMAFILAEVFFFSRPLIGWPSLIFSIWFLGGLMIFFIGIIGIYLSKVFIETKGRPYTIVRAVYRNGKK